jgi:hypothetical protein
MDSIVLNVLSKVDVREAFLAVVSDERFQVNLEKVIEEYPLASITKSDVVTITERFIDSVTGLNANINVIVTAVWNGLVNVQRSRNTKTVKYAILKIVDDSILLPKLKDNSITEAQYKMYSTDLSAIVDRELAKVDLTNYSNDALQPVLSKINQSFTVDTINHSAVFASVQETTSRNILRNNLVVTFVDLIGYKLEADIRAVVDKNLTKVPMDPTIIDNIISDIQDTLNVSFNLSKIVELRSIILTAMKEFKDYEGTAETQSFVTINPKDFSTGTITLEEKVPISIQVTPTEVINLANVETRSVEVSLKPVEEFVNVTNFDIQAKIIEPKFKINVCGSDCGVMINEDDKWKVLTNDGETAQWEYIGNLLGTQIGFLKIVETLSERNNIPRSHRVVGMLCYVLSRDTYYKLEDASGNSWSVFKQGFNPHRLNRTVVFENVKLGHGDKGSDLRISDVKSTIIDTKGDYRYLDEAVDVEYANLISFKNVGYEQAMLVFEGNKHILNPNSVFEMPFDGTLRFQIKGIFNFVSAFITFDTECEVIKADCCDPIRHKHDMESIFDPYF